MDPLDDTATIHPAREQLSAEVPLSVHLVTGGSFAVLVDTGVAGMYGLIDDLIRQTLDDPRSLKLIINTHAHHDHIGCNARVSELTGALVAASSEHAAWHVDLERHYREFAQEHPDLVPDTPQLRAEVLDTIDAPRAVDLYIDDGTVVDLGGGVVIQVLSLPGHMPGELGVVERRTRTLILGDALTGVDWSFFHGYSDVDVYLGTLATLRAVIRDERIERVRAAHYDCMTGAEGLAAIDRVEEAVAAVDAVVRQTAQERGDFGLGEIWADVSRSLAKAQDFRGLRVVEAHLRRLVASGAVDEPTAGSFRWSHR
jgi:glyoxylase-like metal-dependent hydrolase (beta-lactamase superfamily II)